MAGPGVKDFLAFIFLFNHANHLMDANVAPYQDVKNTINQLKW